jgi:hypothetical protein
MDKKQATMDILNSLNISSLRQKREGQVVPEAPTPILDPDEPGLPPEEVARRRQLILQAPPEQLREMEQKSLKLGAPSPLELTLSELKKKKAQSAAMDEEEVSEPTNVTGVV